MWLFTLCAGADRKRRRESSDTPLKRTADRAAQEPDPAAVLPPSLEHDRALVSCTSQQQRTPRRPTRRVPLPPGARRSALTNALRGSTADMQHALRDAIERGDSDTIRLLCAALGPRVHGTQTPLALVAQYDRSTATIAERSLRALWQCGIEHDPALYRHVWSAYFYAWRTTPNDTRRLLRTLAQAYPPASAEDRRLLAAVLNDLGVASVLE